MQPDIFFNLIKEQHAKSLPFVAYRKPGSSTVFGMFQQTDAVYSSSDYKESGFVFAPFDTAEKTILFPAEKCKICTTIIDENKKGETKSVTNDDFTSEENHIKLVKKGIDVINSGYFNKVVLSRKQEVSISGVDKNSIELFSKLLSSYPDAFVYCWFHPKVGLWLGATPESLFSVSGNTLKTMALAGTQKYTGAAVFWGEKEKEEQQIVTDYIVKSLSGVVSNLRISETETVRAGNLLHLRTIVKGDLIPKKGNIKSIVEQLHPTPAVCGFPKEKAKQFILDNENHDREFYTGFLGELNLNGSSNFYVNLRCMKLENNKVNIYVGGGITKDSVPADEWKETVNKSQTMMRVLE